MNNKLLSQLYHKYHRELYLYLYSLCGNTALAEDLTQETFLKALLALPDNHINMRAWLYLVARNLYYNYYKKEKAKLPLEDYSELQDDACPEILQQMIVDDNRRMLYLAMAKLDAKKREVLQMQYFGNLSQKEIAVILHMTPENIRVLAYRAKKELKTYLEVQGYELS